MNPRNIVFVVITVLGVLADQLTKWWIVANVELGTGEIVIFDGWLSLVHAQNPGAAFGLLRGFEYRHWVFLVFTLIAGGVILDLLRKLPKSDWFMSLTLGLIFSGAVGNAIDRVRQQVVTDFIRVYTDDPGWKQWLVETVGTYEWPSFNVADAALVVGVAFFVLHELFIGSTTDDDAAKADAPEAEGSTEAEAEPTHETELAATRMMQSAVPVEPDAPTDYFPPDTDVTDGEGLLAFSTDEVPTESDDVPTQQGDPPEPRGSNS